MITDFINKIKQTGNFVSDSIRGLDPVRNDYQPEVSFDDRIKSTAQKLSALFGKPASKVEETDDATSEITKLKEEGKSLSQIRKAIGIMDVPNREELIKKADSIFNNQTPPVRPRNEQETAFAEKASGLLRQTAQTSQDLLNAPAMAAEEYARNSKSPTLQKLSPAVGFAAAIATPLPGDDLLAGKKLLGKLGKKEAVKMAEDLKPLAAEARKYKSAEEFVKAINPIDTPNVYIHQTDGKITEKFNTKEVWVAPDDTAFYGKNSVKVFAESKKPFDLEVPENQALYEKLGGEANPKTFDELRKLGYDSVVETNGDRAFLYPDRVSQLTDLYNQAVKGGEGRASIGTVAKTAGVVGGIAGIPLAAGELQKIQTAISENRDLTREAKNIVDGHIGSYIVMGQVNHDKAVKIVKEMLKDKKRWAEKIGKFTSDQAQGIKYKPENYQ